MDRYTEFDEVEYACSEGYVWSKYTWQRQVGIEDQHSINRIILSTFGLWSCEHKWSHYQPLISYNPPIGTQKANTIVMDRLEFL